MLKKKNQVSRNSDWHLHTLLRRESTKESPGKESHKFGKAGTFLKFTSTYWFTPQNNTQLIEQHFSFPFGSHIQYTVA